MFSPPEGRGFNVSRLPSLGTSMFPPTPPCRLFHDTRPGRIPAGHQAMPAVGGAGASGCRQPIGHSPTMHTGAAPGYSVLGNSALEIALHCTASAGHSEHCTASAAVPLFGRKCLKGPHCPRVPGHAPTAGVHLLRKKRKVSAYGKNWVRGTAPPGSQPVSGQVRVSSSSVGLGCAQFARCSPRCFRGRPAVGRLLVPGGGESCCTR